MKNSGNTLERARRYIEAMKACPVARQSELKEFEVYRFDTTGEFKIIDLGAGEGFLSRYLAQSFSKSSIHAVDYSPFLLASGRPDRVVAALGSESCLAFSDRSVDLVFSLATLHGCSDRLQTFLEVGRVLSAQGKFLVADVVAGSPAQRFFEEVTSEYGECRSSLNFLDDHEMARLAKASGLMMEDFTLKETPWKFESSRQLYTFVKELLCLQISEEALEFKIARHFGVYPRPGKVELPWQLGYYTFRKADLL